MWLLVIAWIWVWRLLRVLGEQMRSAQNPVPMSTRSPEGRGEPRPQRRVPAHLFSQRAPHFGIQSIQEQILSQQTEASPASVPRPHKSRGEKLVRNGAIWNAPPAFPSLSLTIRDSSKP